MNPKTNSPFDKQSAKQKLEDLDVLSNFMFNAIATDKNVAKPFFRKVLKILLEKEIGDIKINAQPFIPADTPDHRGIYMDVTIKEKFNTKNKRTIYSVEAQCYTEPYLQKRVRFYQAKKDSKGLKRGEKNWNKLPDMYMIIITNYDPFGEDSMIYSFENTCKEFPFLTYNDGLKIIYFNVNGTKNCRKSIKQLLSYLNSSKIEMVANDDIKQLHNYVTEVKREADTMVHFVTWEEYADILIRQQKDDIRKQAIEEGRAIGLEAGHAAGLEAGHAAGLEAGHAAGHAEGLTEGIRLSLLSLLSDLGAIPEKFIAKTQAAGEETLTKWLKLAAHSSTIEEFLKQIK